MTNWIEKREKYLDENPDLEKTEDKCPITQDHIFDKVSLEEENKAPFFERHALLTWLLSTPKPQHPINHTEVSKEHVLDIFKAGIARDDVKKNEENDFDLYT
ncbi:MAG: hypothetical protein K940chlam5_00459 [Candidatus Anoxychlamydiales bacterium]|nr:hypothetical protein [Candidatus Anoxychlamydiales bacterium]